MMECILTINANRDAPSHQKHVPIKYIPLFIIKVHKMQVNVLSDQDWQSLIAQQKKAH